MHDKNGPGVCASLCVCLQSTSPTATTHAAARVLLLLSLWRNPAFNTSPSNDISCISSRRGGADDGGGVSIFGVWLRRNVFVRTASRAFARSTLSECVACCIIPICLGTSQHTTTLDRICCATACSKGCMPAGPWTRLKCRSTEEQE